MPIRAIAAVTAGVAASVMLIAVAFGVADAIFNEPVEEVAQHRVYHVTSMVL